MMHVTYYKHSGSYYLISSLIPFANELRNSLRKAHELHWYIRYDSRQYTADSNRYGPEEP